MTDQQPHTPPECDHHWISYMQPSAGLSWIRQCSQCRDFDADDLQEQIADAEQRGAVKALREFADAHRVPYVMFRGENYEVTVSDLLRETARDIEQGSRADQMEGDE